MFVRKRVFSPPSTTRGQRAIRVLIVLVITLVVATFSDFLILFRSFIGRSIRTSNEPNGWKQG